jgi:hypothetical protein
MSLFEYLSIAFSLVLSFSVLRLLSGLPYAVRAERRYWVHLAFLCMQLLQTAITFWIHWSYRDASWNLPKFLLSLSGPAIGLYLACALIPENPSEIASWREHYFSVRRAYFGGIILWVLVVFASSTAIAGLPLVHPGRIGQVATLAVGVTGALSSSGRVHSVLASGSLLVLFLLGSTVFLRPMP